MKKYEIKTRIKTFLADTITPVSSYLKLRDKFANTLLLESSDYHGEENSFSYICCKPISSFEVLNGVIKSQLPGGEKTEISGVSQLDAFKTFRDSFQHTSGNKKYIETGLFGYINYDSVTYFEDLSIEGEPLEIPELKYSLFKYIVAFDHFRNQCHVIESFLTDPDEIEYKELLDILSKQSNPVFNFERVGEIRSNMDDEEFLQIVKKGIHHCEIGDVFQVVFSRKFESNFIGDEFQVYRTLRSINPSPYLFYFDYGSYKVFGSSPEAQIDINQEEAIIYPIAGTFKRTGDDNADAELARALLTDEKENSEHIMLVDLARNDLSKFTEDVTVETYKEIQYYSHVIHLVSKVTGKLKEGTDILEIVASTFPAGTLSGAPKYKAMQLIEEYEKNPRGYYGGAIGFMDFESTFNHAIMIRTFMSHNNVLRFQAGAGIVAKSNPENEVQEVYNKLAALQKAMEEAEKLSN